jgi:hypothetical protein
MTQPAQDWTRHDVQVLWQAVPVYLWWYQP